jgi:predicted Zn-dependent protease
MRMPRVVVVLFAAGIMGAMLAGCATNPATGRSQFNVLSREDEIAIGNEATPQLTQEYGGAISDASLNQYITGVATRMVEHTESDYRALPWQFTLLNSSVINAFALPGGKVFLSRALAEKFTSEAQLAGVLGHEIGHVTAEHADRAIGQALILQGIAITAGILAGDSAAAQQAAGLLVDASGTFALTFTREQENEADRLGMRYMTRAGYHPRGMLEVMQVLAAASKGRNPPEWQSTHPSPETRIGIIQERLESEGFRERIARGDLQTFEARFQSEFLARLRAVPPPADQRRGEIDIEDPASWCLHCARRTALAGR